MRRTLVLPLVMLLAVFAIGQQPAGQAPADSGAVIRTQTKLVLVDTVATDKKGSYIHDLTAKDFRVWEDNKEQEIKTFSFEADAASLQRQQPRYLVLFFDLSTMQANDQIYARQAAAKFVDGNTGPNRLVAVVNYGGSLQIAQNFTSDADRLKKVVSGVKFSAINVNDPSPAGTPSLGGAAMAFGVRDSILALRSLAKSLSTVPGRKTLVLLTAGFPVTPEITSEITATIDVCNKANVAIYPIDVRGLVPPSAELQAPDRDPATPDSPRPSRPGLGLASFGFFQRGGTPGGGSPGGGAPTGGGGSRGGAPGGGGTTGGGRSGTGSGSGGGSTGGRGTTGNSGVNNINNPNNRFNPNNPFNQSRNLVPKFPDSATTNQQLMYMLASGTGGFVIANTNDLTGGLEKIASEQNEYYVLGYAPPDSDEGSCHVLKVKAERSGVVIRSRTGYCNVRPPDLLAGSSTEKELESRVAAAGPGNVKATMLLPYFYSAPNTARVDVAMEIPTGAIKFNKEKGKFHSEINVLGVAYNADGKVAARFSDTVKLHFDKKKEVEEFQEEPLHYENQFDIGSGQYTLKVAFSSGGDGFGKVEAPLNIDPFDNNQLGLGGVAFSRHMRPVAQLEAGLDAALVEDRAPLVAQGQQFVPTGSSTFKQGETALLYTEVYEPLLAATPAPTLGLQMRVLDRATGQEKKTTGFMTLASLIKTGHPLVPIGLKLPVDGLAPGAYRLEVTVADSAGHKAPVRLADFDLAPGSN